MVTFHDIARDAQLEGGVAATVTATQRKGPRLKNAERRHRKQTGGFDGKRNEKFRWEFDSNQ